MKDSQHPTAREHALQSLLECIVHGGKQPLLPLLQELGFGDNRQLKRNLETIQEGASFYGENLAKEFQPTQSMAQTSLADAPEKLNAIIRLTADAANEVINLAEQQEHSLRKAERLLHGMKNQFDADPTIAQKTRHAFEVFYHSELQHITASKELNQNILMAQSYQDITGQHAKKVIRTIDSVKKNILGFFSLFQKNIETNIVEMTEEVPQTALRNQKQNKSQVEDTSMNQDDVDDILKSLDF